MNTGHNLNSRSGMTLGEVMISMALTVIAVTATLNAVVQGTRVTYMTSQQVAAFQVCKDTFEQMQGMSYSALDVDHFATQYIPFCFAGGSPAAPLTCVRQCEIVAMPDPPRKDVTIRVAWTFWGKPLEHVFCGTIYRKETRDNAVVNGGVVSGTVGINPNSSPSAEFTMVRSDGSVLTLSDLDDTTQSYDWEVTAIHLMPKGGSSQQLSLDGQPYPLSNNNVYDITTESHMHAAVYNSHPGLPNGHWMLTISGSAADSTITMR